MTATLPGNQSASATTAAGVSSGLSVLQGTVVGSPSTGNVHSSTSTSERLKEAQMQQQQEEGSKMAKLLSALASSKRVVACNMELSNSLQAANRMHKLTVILSALKAAEDQLTAATEQVRRERQKLLEESQEMLNELHNGQAVCATLGKEAQNSVGLLQQLEKQNKPFPPLAPRRLWQPLVLVLSHISARIAGAQCLTWRLMGRSSKNRMRRSRTAIWRMGRLWVPSQEQSVNEGGSKRVKKRRVIRQQRKRLQSSTAGLASKRAL